MDYFGENKWLGSLIFPLLYGTKKIEQGFTLMIDHTFWYFYFEEGTGEIKPYCGLFCEQLNSRCD